MLLDLRVFFNPNIKSFHIQIVSGEKFESKAYCLCPASEGMLAVNGDSWLKAAAGLQILLQLLCFYVHLNQTQQTVQSPWSCKISYYRFVFEPILLLKEHFPVKFSCLVTLGFVSERGTFSNYSFFDRDHTQLHKFFVFIHTASFLNKWPPYLWLFQETPAAFHNRFINEEFRGSW